MRGNIATGTVGPFALHEIPIAIANCRSARRRGSYRSTIAIIPVNFAQRLFRKKTESRSRLAGDDTEDPSAIDAAARNLARNSYEIGERELVSPETARLQNTVEACSQKILMGFDRQRTLSLAALLAGPESGNEITRPPQHLIGRHGGFGRIGHETDLDTKGNIENCYAKAIMSTTGRVDALCEELSSLQADSGAFESEVWREDGRFTDYNGFITALVLRETAAFEGPGWLSLRRRALDFIEECESPFRPGRFSFWPRTRWPGWAKPVPDDCDCTASMASLLLEFGRINGEKAEAIATHSLGPYQRADGCFVAWQYDGEWENPVDLVLNANVIAFLARIGWSGRSAFENACAGLSSAVTGCARQPERLRMCTPYHPNPEELARSVHHAVKLGATRLCDTAAELRWFCTGTPDVSMRGTVFTTLDRRTRWSSLALQLVRRLTSVV